jgi:hypothetical protein
VSVSWLDREPPKNPSLAKAYWCEMNYFLAHTSSGDHLPCECPEGMGHNAPEWPEWRAKVAA